MACNYFFIITCTFVIFMQLNINYSSDLHQVPNVRKRVTHYVKRGKSPVNYYNNSVSTFNLILECGDVEKNPGPRKTQSNLTNQVSQVPKKAPSCSSCSKGVGMNRKRLICTNCFGLTHVSCSQLSQRNFEDNHSLSYDLRCKRVVLDFFTGKWGYGT